MPPETPQLYLIHGQDVEAINQSRDQTLDRLIPSESRYQNMSEFISETNRALRLADIASDIMNELSTLSLFEESRRVVVVVDLRDLCDGGGGRGRRPKKSKSKSKAPAPGKGKADATEKFCDYLTRTLPQTPNAIVFVNYEKDLETTVSKTSPLYKAVKAAGQIHEYKGENKTFAFQDALLGRNAETAVRLFREQASKTRSEPMLFNALLRTTRGLLQAKVVSIKQRDGARADDLKALFPQDKSGFFNQHPFVQKKNLAGARNFKTSELTEALEELLEINRLVIPMSTDVYVRDFALAVEIWILKWFSRPRGRR